MAVRTQVLVGIAAVLGIAAVAGQIAAKRLERNLLDSVRPTLTEIVEQTNGCRIVGFDAVATHRFLVVGPATGKVSMYVAATGQDGKETYVAYTFFYKKEGTTWIMTESGACSSPECRIRAETLDAVRNE